MKKYLLVTSVVLVTFFVSCTPPVYLPNSLNTPLLKEKGEFNIGLSRSIGGCDFQASKAISDNIGFMVNATYLRDEWSDNYRDHKFAEMGIGYFSHPDKYLVNEIYVGAGLGTNSIKEAMIFSSEDAEISADYIRLFIQPNFGVCTEGFEGGFSMRACYINFHKVNFSNIDFIKTRTLFEPVVFMRIGPPNLKFQTQLGYSLRPLKDPLEFSFFYDELIFSFGFNIRLNIK
jgi:hypothetical protein